MNKMGNSETLKNIVKDKYAQIATTKSCCSCGSDCSPEYSVLNDSYESQQGYVKEADLGLGCGLPTEYADIHPGDSVLDLGSGAGNDCFVARAIVGDTGKVTGLDFTDEMIYKAIANNEKSDFKNVEFVKGDIEKMPLPDYSYDVIISNCVINLVPNKQKAFSEIFRVLRNKGHFCISDIVLKGILPKKLQEAAEMYAGCVSGTLQRNDYLNVIESTGFKNVEIKKEKQIIIPNSILLKYLSVDELNNFNKSEPGIYSITVVGKK